MKTKLFQVLVFILKILKSLFGILRSNSMIGKKSAPSCSQTPEDDRDDGNNNNHQEN